MAVILMVRVPNRPSRRLSIVLVQLVRIVVPPRRGRRAGHRRDRPPLPLPKPKLAELEAAGYKLGALALPNKGVRIGRRNEKNDTSRWPSAAMASSWWRGSLAVREGVAP
jgi:hypothetical protein